LAFSGVREALRALAWTQAVEGAARLPFRDAFAARLAGGAVNTPLPLGVVGGGPGKAKKGGHRLSVPRALCALMIEFAFYAASLPLLFGAATMTLVPATAMLALPVSGMVFTRKAQALAAPVLEFVSLHKRHTSMIAACQVGYHLLAIAEVYVVLALIAPGRASVVSALVFEPVNRGVTIVFKMLPMRIGVDEAGAALAAGRFDLSSSTGVTVALVRKLRTLVWAAVGLLILVARSTGARK